MLKAIILLLCLLSCVINAESATLSQTDRELLIRISERVEMMNAKFEQVDKRFEQVDRRLEQIENREDNHFVTIITVFIGFFVTMIGFIFWDRRMALVPVNAKMASLETELSRANEENSKIKSALKDFAEKNIDFKDIFSRAAF